MVLRPPVIVQNERYNKEAAHYRHSGLFPPGHRKARGTSVDSDASDCSDFSGISDVSWGSNKVALGCNCISHNDEELEVANWLLFSGEQDLSIRPLPPSQKTPSCRPPFSILNIPGNFFLQVIFAVLIYWGFIPNHPPRNLHPIPPAPIFPPKSFVKPDRGNRPAFLRARHDGTFIKLPLTEYYGEDDIEYLVPPTPGTDEEVMRISVTNDHSREKIETQAMAAPDVLRIYRVSLDDLGLFELNVQRFGMIGHIIRKPYDSFDTVKVIRQGHMSWDLGDRDERWMLIGRNAEAIYRILDRCDRRPPPFKTRMLHFFLKIGYKIIYPWTPTWILGYFFATY